MASKKASKMEQMRAQKMASKKAPKMEQMRAQKRVSVKETPRLWEREMALPMVDLMETKRAERMAQRTVRTRAPKTDGWMGKKKESRMGNLMASKRAYRMAPLMAQHSAAKMEPPKENPMVLKKEPWMGSRLENWKAHSLVPSLELSNSCCFSIYAVHSG